MTKPSLRSLIACGLAAIVLGTATFPLEMVTGSPRALAQGYDPTKDPTSPYYIPPPTTTPTLTPQDRNTIIDQTIVPRRTPVVPGTQGTTPTNQTLYRCPDGKGGETVSTAPCESTASKSAPKRTPVSPIVIIPDTVGPAGPNTLAIVPTAKKTISGIGSLAPHNGGLLLNLSNVNIGQPTLDDLLDPSDKAQMGPHLLGPVDGARIDLYGAVIDELIRENDALFGECTTVACQQHKLFNLKVLLQQKVLDLAVQAPSTWTADQRHLMELMLARQQELREEYANHLQSAYDNAKKYPCGYDSSQPACGPPCKFCMLAQGGPTITPTAVQNILQQAQKNFENTSSRKTDAGEIAETAAMAFLLNEGLQMIADPNRIKDVSPDTLARIYAAIAILKQAQTSFVQFDDSFTDPSTNSSGGSILGAKAKIALAGMSLAEGALTIVNAVAALNADRTNLTDQQKLELDLAQGWAIGAGASTIANGAAAITEVAASMASKTSTVAQKIGSVAGKVGGITGIVGGAAGLAGGILSVVQGARDGNNVQITTGTFSIVAGGATLVSGIAATAQSFGALTTVASGASAVAGPLNILALAATIGTVEGARVFGNIDAENELKTMITESKARMSMTAFRQSLSSDKGRGMVSVLTAF